MLVYRWLLSVEQGIFDLCQVRHQPDRATNLYLFLHFPKIDMQLHQPAHYTTKELRGTRIHQITHSLQTNTRKQLSI